MNVDTHSFDEKVERMKELMTEDNNFFICATLRDGKGFSTMTNLHEFPASHVAQMLAALADRLVGDDDDDEMTGADLLRHSALIALMSDL